MQRVNLDSLLVEELALMPMPRSLFSAAHLDGFIYVLGGTNSPYLDEETQFHRFDIIDIQITLSLFCIWKINPYEISLRFRYNIETNQWTYCARFVTHPMPNCTHGEFRNTYGVNLCPYNGRLYAIGGQWFGPVADACPKVTCYEPTTDDWLEISDMVEPKIFVQSFVANDALHTAGGKFVGYQLLPFDAIETSKIELYDNTQNQWMPVGFRFTAFVIAFCK